MDNYRSHRLKERALAPASAVKGTRLPIYFLEASTPLTKTFTKTKTELVKTPYPFVWEFTSHKEQVKDLAAFEKLLQAHAIKHHCLLKGTVSHDLVKESRAGSTDTNSPTDWIVLDFDGLPEQIPDVDSALGLMGLGDYSYVVQYSASYGIENWKLRAHVFMILDKTYAAPLLKQWTINLNHTVPMLRTGMTLTKTGNSISWPLDISANQNDKLIYIAPPVLNGMKDPMTGKPRITLVKKKFDKLSIQGNFSSEKNRELTNKRIAELRDQEGLPKRKFTYKMHGATEILMKPDSATITDMKQERGFVYFNLNGGDSWAYYHPENNPEFIYNFKGEPNYLTKELLPEYWEQLTANPTRMSSEGIVYLAFCDRATSSYYRGTFDASSDTLDLHQAKNETQVRHFAKQYGMPLGDYIPEWDLAFNPRARVGSERVDFQTKTINLFSPTIYMQQKPKPQQGIPALCWRVMSHALGDEQDIIEHFVNWLAYIVQFRDRTKTAWVMHGTTGTGKGVLMNKILRPILGFNHTTARRMEEFNEPYNHYMKNSLLVFVDEVQTKALQNERGVMAKLKNFITEEWVPIRAMYHNGVESRNYTNWIFASNMPDPVAIDREDRRFNVGKYQPNKLILTDKEYEQIDSELQDFHDFLMLYPVDAKLAGSILETADRTTMIGISENSLDTVSRMILEGNFEFLMDQLPSGQNFNTDWRYLERLTAYQSVLKSLIERTNDKRKCNIAREELRLIFDFIVGNMPVTPNKFTSLLKHHRIHIEKVWSKEEDKAISGIQVHWSETTHFEAYSRDLTPKVAMPKPKEDKPAKPANNKVVPIGSKMGRKAG